MAIDKILNNITNNKAFSKAGKAFGSAANTIGAKYEKGNFKNIYEKFLEPEGANNPFPIIAGLMIFVGVSPRFIAAEKRNYEIVQELMKFMKEDVNRTDSSGRTAMMLAAIGNQEEDKE